MESKLSASIHPELWPPTLLTDYNAAAVRLVTLTNAKIQHLLFAYVELYPREIPFPPKSAPRLRTNFRDSTLSITSTVLPVVEALAWYESAIAGNLIVPGISSKIPIATMELSPEPALGRLLISDDLPFSVRWHAGPRVHRLVPMDTYPEPIIELSSGEKDERQTKIREWLADSLGFDLLAYDDCLCGLVLLAPNPVVRGVGTFIKETRPDSSERLAVKAALRQGVLGDTLRVQLREERPGGTIVLEKRLDPFGMAEFDWPERCERSGLQLICDERGVLTLEPAAHFIRGISVSSYSAQPQGQVQVPARGKREPATTYPLPALRVEPAPAPSPPLSGALRLEYLLTRRRGRTGHRRPDGFVRPIEDDERVLFEDRLGAISFVQRGVRAARERVIFVDPYFDHIDVRRFALMTQYEGVSVSVLTGYGDHLFWSVELPEGGAALAGDVIAAHLSELDTELQVHKRPLPEVLLMGERGRVYHDRFLVIDNVVWHFGHSFNQIGGSEVSMATRLGYPDEIREAICEDIGRANTFLSSWPGLKARRQQRDVPKARESVWFRLKAAFVSRFGRS